MGWHTFVAVSGLLRVVAVSFVIVLAGCGQTAQRPSASSAYRVVAPLLDMSGQTYACYLMAASLPPAGCGGVHVKNVNIGAIPGEITYGENIVLTPRVTLTGVWDGQALTLTEPPTSIQVKPTQPRAVKLPTEIAAKGNPAQVEEHIAHDMIQLQAQGIQIIWYGTGEDGVDVVLAVADKKSVQTLYNKYGRVHISGWLEAA